MATTKKRVNITLSKDAEEAISFLAKRDSVPEATKAAELLREALEMEEDKVLSMLSEERDTKDSTFVSHIEAWK